MKYSLVKLPAIPEARRGREARGDRISSMARWRVGVDSGGTFTDICLFDEDDGRVEVWKVSSTPDDPSR
jgi:hypothetical protein